MKFIIVLIVWVAPMVLCAQSSIDLLTLSGFYGFPSSYENPLTGKATEMGSLMNLKVPVVLNSNTTWYNDFTYTLYAVNHDIDPEPAGMITSLKLQAFILQTGIAHKINDQNGFQFLFLPRYTTDSHGINKKNWQLGGIGLYEHRFSSRLLMRFGALYNNELFGPLLVPLIYTDWQVSKKWSITGLFPINLKASYTINDQFSAGYSHFGFTTTYYVNEPDFKSDYIERNSIDETLFVRVRLTGNVHLETRMGYSLGRVYAQYNENAKMDFRLSIFAFGDDRMQKNVNFNSGPIASLRLVYNLPLDKQND